MIGSHNSFSYCRPLKWWMIIFSPWSKCQSKTVYKQIDSGVRFFDIRCKWIESKSSFYIAHGSYITDMPVLVALDILRAEGKNIHYRLVLEYNKRPKGGKKILDNFVKLISYAQSINEIILEKAILKWDWAYIFTRMGAIPMVDHYSSVKIPKWKQIFITPRRWAKRFNGHIKVDENTILLMDFV